MTREEAIQALNEIFDDSEFSRYEAWYGTAMNMAIEALKTKHVRCGECLHLKVECGDEGTCFFWCKHWENATDSWGWCYYGERIEQ